MIADGATAIEGRELALSVDFAPVADADDQDANEFIFDAGDDSIIADAIFPKVAKLSSLQRLANAARIFKGSDALEEKAVDAVSYLRIEMAQFTLGYGVKINRQCHIHSSHPQEESSSRG